MNNVVTRFAPSPTGYLHIGSARTALFNYLFAKSNNGRFLLRIEDTDRKRSTDKAIEAILDGLKWMGLSWDGEEVTQFSKSERHKEVALELLNKGKAYKCFLSSEELEKLREKSMKTGEPIRSKWRDAKSSSHPDAPYVVRLKSPREGVTILEDEVQGTITTENHTLDDMILLRSDGTPTYMLAVVVDDHDMGVTHVIRGDDHLSNTPRQIVIYEALGWKVPSFSHIPLIHGPDGKKLSKRHGALGVEGYRDMGYLPETICNYLLRLGWSHGDDEIITQDQAIEWFNLESIGKSPSRLDFKKMNHLNNHYLKEADNDRVLLLMLEHMPELSDQSKENIFKGLNSLKQRANTILELVEMAKIYILEEEIEIPEDLKKIIMMKFDVIQDFQHHISKSKDWTKEDLMERTKAFAISNKMKLGEIAGITRVLLTGSTASPSVFEIMSILGKDATVKRLGNVYNS
ncbi:MAG: glutamate--tRNA ligase [Rickettsiales bacterium]|jgi:glutamyl-tRNA synthetase|nr:glutamate--tRNA ligase [Rickettsiales bacterium]